MFFLGLALLYLSLSPGRTQGMGYTGENMKAANQIISNLGEWVALRPATTNIDWPRHGLFELLFEIPFLLIARIFFGGSSPEWGDRMMSLQPALLTSLICTLVFAWVHRITSSLIWAYVLAMVAAFSTMLWPYAYIGLETTPSLFLILTAYLALAADPTRTWRRALVFALSCAMAISLKTNSIFLVPAVAYLIYAYFDKGFSSEAGESRKKWKQLTAIVAIIAGLYFLNAYTRSLSPVWYEGMARSYFRGLAIDGPLSFLFALLSFIGSPNKGLLIYCPVLIICLAVLHKVYKTNPRLVIFVILATAGLIGGCSLFYYWSEETWGPRYLHSCIAPLIVCFAAARASVRFRWRRETPLLALTVWGVAVSFLGVFFYYGSLHLAATQAIHPTIEAFQYEPEWNHIRFNAKLMQEWIHGSRPDGDIAPWPPPRHRWYPENDELPMMNPEKTANLHDYALPQPLIFRSWDTLKTTPTVTFWYVFLNCLWLGPGLLIWLARRASREDRS